MTEHELNLDNSVITGMVRAQCSCGWTGTWQTTDDAATEEWDFHCDDVFEEATRP